MSYRIKRKESVQTAIRRIAVEQIDKALSDIDNASRDRHRAIHQVRKRCKKLRGLLRLVRPALGKTYEVENKALRDAARRISGFRDAKTIVSSYDELLDQFDEQIDRHAFSSVRLRLAKQLQTISDDAIDRELAKVRSVLKAAKKRVPTWKLKKDGYEAVRLGMSKTRERAEKRLAEAREHPTTDSLHEFRKRVKYHWCHLRLLRNVWEEALDPIAKVSKRLGDQLGDDHDLAVFRQKSRANAKRSGKSNTSKKQRKNQLVLKGLIGRQRESLQDDSFKLGRKLFAESTDAFDDRLKVYWSIWREENAG